MSTKPYLLSETHLGTVRAENYSIALLPWGATEAHNFHLPYGTDNFETSSIAEESARLAWDDGARCVVLPGVPFGVNTGQTDIPGTINIYPSTQAVLLDDILESVYRTGIRKFLLLNGHGGNDFKQILREAGSNYPDMLLVQASWFLSIDKKQFFENPGDHADEMETSLMMHLYPEMVLPLSQAGDGNAKKFRINALNESWTWTERKWSDVTIDTGIGDPYKANADKGKACFVKICEKISTLIVELALADNHSFYK